ncbi:MAG: glycosyltransferase family 39 protein [candidate division Zixibacteria bacterium]|nr:glycosyltransferase family 39 protein [candidate division Zixibacteria bacterium]
MRSYLKSIGKVCNTVSSHAWYPTGLHLLLIAGAGVLIRIAYARGLEASGFMGAYSADCLVLHTWATSILSGDTTSTAFFRAPLYPHLLALWYHISGISSWTVIAWQGGIGLLTGFTSYFLARHLFGSTIALYSALVVVAYPTLVYYEGEPLITSLFVLLFTLTVYLLVRAVTDNDLKYVVLAGLVLGIGAITRPTIIPLVIVYPLVSIIQFGRTGLKRTVRRSFLLVLAMLIPVLPVTAFNYFVGGEFVPISTQGGINFYIGNSASSDGLTVRAPGPNLRIGDYNDNIWTSSLDEAEFQIGRELSQGEVSSYWYTSAYQDIFHEPLRWLTLMAKKFYMFWHGSEIFNNRPLYYARQYSSYMSITLWSFLINFPSGLLFPLALVGGVLGYRNRKNIVVPIHAIGLYALVISAFFVCARFRQPVIPVAVMFAVYAIGRLGSMAVRNRRRFWGGIGLFGLLVVVLNWGGQVDSTGNRSQFHSLVGQTLLQHGKYGPGVMELEKALDILPDNLMVYDELGQTHLWHNRPQEAKQIYLRGMEVNPTHPIFNYNLGRIAQSEGHLNDALNYYRQTIEYSIGFDRAIYGIASVFEQKQQYDSALFYYERTKELNGYEGEDARRLDTRIEIMRLKLDLD